jgi:AcrR family transcriptional regulator
MENERSFSFSVVRGFGVRQANLQRQSDRRHTILDAAQRCFARSGFHGASMQEICIEAGMSPGNLYRYFASKEAIIAGIAERDRGELAHEFDNADFSHGLFAVLETMARHHFSERPDDQVSLYIEIMAEARRNPEIARIHQGFDADVRQRLLAMLREGVCRGEVAAEADLESAITMLMLIADGVWSRKATDPSFDAGAMLPVFMDVVRHLLGTATKSGGTAS